MPMNLLMCQACIDLKYEPRWVIILAGRSQGPDYVKEFIIRRRYVGNEVSASELLV